MRPWTVLPLWLSSVSALAGPGAPPIQLHEFSELQTYYAHREVHPGSDGEIWAVSPSGLLRFDGTRWTVQRTADSLLSVARAGTQSCAGSGVQLGQFQPQSDGSWQFVAHPLPAHFPAPRGLLRVARLDHGCVYLSRDAAWWRTDAGDWTRLAFAADAHLLQRDWPYTLRIGDGIAQLSLAGGELRLVPLAQDRGAEGLVARIELDDKVLLIHQDALYIESEGVTRDFAPGLWPMLQQLRPTCAIRTTDRRVAIGTARGGVVVVDDAGQLHEIFGEVQGLPALRINDLAEDAAGGLWVAQMRHIARIDRAAGLSRFDRLLGLPDAVAFVRHEGTLYAGSSAGLLHLIEREAPAQSRFEPVAHNFGAVYDLLATQAGLMVAHADGLTLLRDARRLELIENSVVRDLQAMRGPGGSADLPILAAGSAGAWLIDGWASTPSVRRIEGVASAARIVDEAPGRYWVTSAPRQFIRIVQEGERFHLNEHDMTAAGLSGLIGVFPRSQGGVWFAGSSGLLAYDDSRQDFVPAAGLDGLSEPGLAVAQMLEDANGNLWLRGGGFTGVAWREAAGLRRDDTVFRAFDARPSVHVYYRDGDLLWVGRTDGALRLDLRRRQPAPAAQLPKLVGIIDETSGRRLSLPTNGVLSLPAARADLRFEFALPLLADSRRTHFRSRLHGYDAGLAPWSQASERVYTNLPHGRFDLELQALDRYNRETAMAPLRIELQAPWHLRPAGLGALTGMALLTLLASARGGARWRARQWLARQRELEAEVSQRTRELAHSNAQLAGQAERLRQIDALKSRLFDNVSHEFRTPLTLVLGPIDDVLRDRRVRLSERIRDSLELAQRNARRVLDLIVELMDLNRIEHGQLPMRRERLQIKSWLGGVVENLRPLAERHGQHLAFHCALDDRHVVAIDPRQIERCITNLVSNAAKFSARGGSIDVALAAGQTAGGVHIEVRDHGCGIPPEQLAHVFERFYQGQRSGSLEGAGIGLALVREIVQAHTGEVGVDSEVGVGSRFWLDLPVGSADPSQAVEAVLDSTDAPAPDESEPSERALVLVVEDHAELRQHLSALLGSCYRVLTAADGETGLALARSELPDLILSDVMMPGMDGITLARRLRADPETAAIGLLLLTARSGTAAAVEGLAAGADDYLAKPFDSTELLARLQALLARRRRLWIQLQRSQRACELPPAGTEARWQERLAGLIERHLDDSTFSIDALASMLHTDRTTLFRRVKSRLGMSPSELLRDARLRRARDLLEAGAGNVTEVACAVGFESQSSFARAFRLRYDESPSAFATTAAQRRRQA